MSREHTPILLESLRSLALLEELVADFPDFTRHPECYFRLLLNIPVGQSILVLWVVLVRVAIGAYGRLGQGRVGRVELSARSDGARLRGDVSRIRRVVLDRADFGNGSQAGGTRVFNDYIPIDLPRITSPNTTCLPSR